MAKPATRVASYLFKQEKTRKDVSSFSSCHFARGKTENDKKLGAMKVGLLGGSFNPVHIGHLRLAVEVLEQAQLDRIELIPASVPPHKRLSTVSSFQKRCKMIEAALKDIPGLNINRMEGQRSGPSYTVDTLEQYRRLYPEREPYFIIGSPDFEHLPQWHEWQRLPHLTHFVVVIRDDAHQSQAGGAAEVADFIHNTWPQAVHEGEGRWTMSSGWKAYLLRIPQLDISSSLIRAKMAKGQSVRFLLPDPVWKMLADEYVRS